MGAAAIWQAVLAAGVAHHVRSDAAVGSVPGAAAVVPVDAAGYGPVEAAAVADTAG
ncbi:hypothetical protein R2360_17335 [Mycobacteroides chelonae]|uniref:hypothetical protein n=1 Tax=Mycobacteroides chelonae TaxID=1774 RepID=UPI000B222D76|nr:hypothetical protein [Mycobacteroides chelonae]MBF9349581.1 hypothetical protein [Mycobacteroides chelonae]MEC4841189.1 hypothetical protein [Mycobacteroides chelonae]MEC4845772.1 hypothetical protein [Mycobacteroides chelonae]WED90592.1 hypothetical protein PXJ67_17425 [Mycobacteroides chelonae]WED97187.1 hypothetical protein PYW02_01030 [Mycobacteroides chelonae]